MVKVYLHNNEEFITDLIIKDKLNPDFENIKFVDFYVVDITNDTYVLKSYDTNIYLCDVCERLTTDAHCCEDNFKCAVCGEIQAIEHATDTEGMINCGIGLVCPDCLNDMR